MWISWMLFRICFKGPTHLYFAQIIIVGDRLMLQNFRLMLHKCAVWTGRDLCRATPTEHILKITSYDLMDRKIQSIFENFISNLDKTFFFTFSLSNLGFKNFKRLQNRRRVYHYQIQLKGKLNFWHLKLNFKMLLLCSLRVSVKCLGGGQDIKGKQPLFQDLTHHTEHSKVSHKYWKTSNILEQSVIFSVRDWMK